MDGEEGRHVYRPGGGKKQPLEVKAILEGLGLDSASGRVLAPSTDAAAAGAAAAGSDSAPARPSPQAVGVQLTAATYQEWVDWVESELHNDSAAANLGANPLLSPDFTKTVDVCVAAHIVAANSSAVSIRKSDVEWVVGRMNAVFNVAGFNFKLATADFHYSASWADLTNAVACSKVGTWEDKPAPFRDLIETTHMTCREDGSPCVLTAPLVPAAGANFKSSADYMAIGKTLKMWFSPGVLSGINGIGCGSYPTVTDREWNRHSNPWNYFVALPNK